VASFFKALGNINVNYLKIPKKHRGPHKRPSRVTCGPRVWDHCSNFWTGNTRKSIKGSKAEVPNLGYSCLSERVHL